MHQLMMEQKHASMMHAMKEMMAEFIRDNGRSETCSAEGSATSNLCCCRWRHGMRRYDSRKNDDFA